MQQGYTLAELEEMDRRRAVRRSFFRKSRRLERELRLDRWWPLYKRLRRAAETELERAGELFDEAQLDTYIEANLPEICKQLAQLHSQDKKSRAARAAIEFGEA